MISLDSLLIVHCRLSMSIPSLSFDFELSLVNAKCFFMLDVFFLSLASGFPFKLTNSFYTFLVSSKVSTKVTLLAIFTNIIVELAKKWFKKIYLCIFSRFVASWNFIKKSYFNKYSNGIDKEMVLKTLLVHL